MTNSICLNKMAAFLRLNMTEEVVSERVWGRGAYVYLQIYWI